MSAVDTTKEQPAATPAAGQPADKGAELKQSPSPRSGDKVAPPPYTPSTIGKDQDFYIPNANDKPQGVLKAEAVKAISGWKLWVAYIGIGLTSYVYSLDNGTTYAYLQQAAQANNYSLYTAASVIQQVVIAIGKLPIAKLSDVFGRAQGYCVSLAFYLVGLIILAASPSFAAICAGSFFYAVGNTGTQIMQQIVVADAVNSRYRGLASGLLSLPYVINFACSPLIVAQLGTPSSWRWGYGMFCLALPVAIAPIIIALGLGQTEAKKKGIVEPHPYVKMGFSRGLLAFCNDIDAGGLFLLCAGWLLILLPLTLHTTAPNGWKTPYIIAMFVVGGVCLILCGLFEAFIAPEPIIRKRFITNRNVVIPAIVGFFDFYSFYLSWSSAYYFVVILKGWSNQDALYFSNAQSLCLTVFGIAAGAFNIFTRRYKYTFWAGAGIRMLGIGLMIAFRDAGSTTAQLVIPQIIQGLGGGILGIELTVASQVSVPHQDVALVTALVLLVTEIGGACGTATLGAIQTTAIPSKLAQLLPNNPQAASAIVLSPYTATFTYPLGSPERTAMIEAWSYYMHRVLTVGIALSAVPILIIPLINNYKLNNKQNVVEWSEDGKPIEKEEFNENRLHRHQSGQSSSA